MNRLVRFVDFCVHLAPVKYAVPESALLLMYSMPREWRSNSDKDVQSRQLQQDLTTLHALRTDLDFAAEKAAEQRFTWLELSGLFFLLYGFCLLVPDRIFLLSLAGALLAVLMLLTLCGAYGIQVRILRLAAHSSSALDRWNNRQDALKRLNVTAPPICP